MSTKTSFKRIALVAVVALSAGVLAAAPSHAAAGDLTVTGALVKGTASTTATTATGVVGNQVIFTYEENLTGAQTVYITSDANGKIVSAANSGATAMGYVNGLNLNDGAKWSVANSAAETATVGLTATAAGTQVVKIQQLSGSTGIYTTVATLTVTWVAASQTDLASANAYVLANGATCDGTVTASAVGSMSYTLASGSALVLCVVLKDGASNLYTRSTAVSVVGNGIGQVAGAAVASDSAVTAGYKAFAIYGNSLSGTASFAVSASSTGTDGVTSVSKTASASVIANGDFTTIKLTNLKKAIAASATATGVLDYDAVDAKGNAAAINLGSGATWYVESDKGTTAVSSSATNNSSATAASAAADTITAATGASADAGRISVTAGSAYEKLTIWVTKNNAAGTTITSNKVVVYVSTATVKSLSIATVASTTGGQTVNVTALSDPATTTTAYPVIDGEAITLGVSSGTLAATSLTTDANGVATTTFYPSQLGGTAILNASAESATVTGSKSVVNADSGISAQIASLVAKINALSKLIAKIQKKLGVK